MEQLAAEEDPESSSDVRDSESPDPEAWRREVTVEERNRHIGQIMEALIFDTDQNDQCLRARLTYLAINTENELFEISESREDYFKQVEEEISDITKEKIVPKGPRDVDTELRNNVIQNMVALSVAEEEAKALERECWENSKDRMEYCNFYFQKIYMERCKSWKEARKEASEKPTVVSGTSEASSDSEGSKLPSESAKPDVEAVPASEAASEKLEVSSETTKPDVEAVQTSESAPDSEGSKLPSESAKPDVEAVPASEDASESAPILREINGCWKITSTESVGDYRVPSLHGDLSCYIGTIFKINVINNIAIISQHDKSGYCDYMWKQKIGPKDASSESYIENNQWIIINSELQSKHWIQNGKLRFEHQKGEESFTFVMERTGSKTYDFSFDAFLFVRILIAVCIGLVICLLVKVFF